MSLAPSSSDDEEFQSPVGTSRFLPHPEEPSSSTPSETPRALRQDRRGGKREEQLALEEVKREEKRQRRLQNRQQPAIEAAVGAEGGLELFEAPDEAEETLQGDNLGDLISEASENTSEQEQNSSDTDEEFNMDGDAVPAAAPVPLPMGSGLPYNKLDPFTGKMDKDFNAWRDQYDLYALTHSWPEATKLLVLPMCLQGNAQDAYRGLDDATKADWGLLCAALERCFHPASVSRFKRVELMHRQQQPGEPVLDYATVIQHLSRGACMGDNENTRKEWMHEFFLHGLNQRLRGSVLNAEPATFEDAVALAQRHEANLHLVQGTTPSRGGIYAGFQMGSRNSEWNYTQNGGTNQNWNQGNRNYGGNRNRNRRGGGWNQNGRQYGGFSDRGIEVTPRNRWTEDGRPVCDICQGIGHLCIQCPGNQGGRGQWAPRGSGQRATPYGGRGLGTSGQGRPVESMQHQGNGQSTRGNGQWTQGNGQWNRGQWNQGNASQGSGNQGASQGSGQRRQGTRGTYRGNRTGVRGGRINTVGTLDGTQDGNPNGQGDQDSIEVTLRGRIAEREHQIQSLQEQVDQLQAVRYPEFVGMVGDRKAASGSAAGIQKRVVPKEGHKEAMPEEGNMEIEQFDKVMAELKQKRKCIEPVEEHPVVAKRGVPEQEVRERRMGMEHAYGQRLAVQDQWKFGVPEENTGLEMPIVEEPRAKAEMQEMILMNGGKVVVKKLHTSILRYVPPLMIKIQPFEEQGSPVLKGNARMRGYEGRLKEPGKFVFCPSPVKLEPIVKEEIVDDKSEMPLILAEQMECDPIEVVVREKQKPRKVGPPVPPKPMKTFRGSDNSALKQAAMLCRPRGVARMDQGAKDTELLLNPEKLQEGATLKEVEENDLWKGGGMTEEEMDHYIGKQEQGAPGTRTGYLKKYRVAKTAPNWKGKSKRAAQVELKEHECLCKQSKPR